MQQILRIYWKGESVRTENGRRIDGKAEDVLQYASKEGNKTRDYNEKIKSNTWFVPARGLLDIADAIYTDMVSRGYNVKLNNDIYNLKNEIIFPDGSSVSLKFSGSKMRLDYGSEFNLVIRKPSKKGQEKYNSML